jgi:hypothetical protein
MFSITFGITPPVPIKLTAFGTVVAVLCLPLLRAVETPYYHHQARDCDYCQQSDGGQKEGNSFHAE